MKGILQKSESTLNPIIHIIIHGPGSVINRTELNKLSIQITFWLVVGVVEKFWLDQLCLAWSPKLDQLFSSFTLTMAMKGSSKVLYKQEGYK